MNIEKLSAQYGRLLTWLALAGCAVLFCMMILICLDVLLRNATIIPGVRGLAWSNEVTESMLYLLTMLTAPWLLRQGQHIRVDILLRAIPRTLAWVFEWICDVMALVCSLVIMWYGIKATIASYSSGAMTIKALITPEWWSIAPLPIAFLLLSIEVLFRMHRLYQGERGPRDDAVSAA